MSDVTRTAGQAQTFPYYLRDSQNNLLTPLSAPQQSIHASSADAATGANPLNGPVALPGAAGAYTATYPVGLAAATYYLRTVTQLTATTTLTDVDDRLILQAVSGSVSDGLCTLDDIKRACNIPLTVNTFDVELQINLDAAKDVIERIKGPVVPRTYTNEVHSGRGQYISLDRRPVISVASVTEYLGGVAYPLTVVTSPAQATAYSCLFEEETGCLTRLAAGGMSRPFLIGDDNVLVTYTAGRSTTPPSVRKAAMNLVQWWWQSTQQGGRPQFQGGQNGAPKGPLPSYAVPNFVYHLLEAGDGVRAPGIA